jgi:hypothetical protein
MCHHAWPVVYKIEHFFCELLSDPDCISISGTFISEKQSSSKNEII